MESYFQTWSKFATFSGRATRTEYWSFILINNAIAILLSIIGIAMGLSFKDGDGLQLFLALFSCFSFIASVSLFVRRLHDINLSGWWGWLFIPLGLPMIIVGFIGSKDKKQINNIPSPQNSTSNFKSENVYKSTQSTEYSETSNDDALYEQAMTEIEEDTKVRGTWAKALANSDGNIDKAKSLYIQMRVNDLMEKDKVKKIDSYRKSLEDEGQKIEAEEYERLLVEEEERVLGKKKLTKQSDDYSLNEIISRRKKRISLAIFVLIASLLAIDYIPQTLDNSSFNAILMRTLIVLSWMSGLYLIFKILDIFFLFTTESKLYWMKTFK